MITIVSDGTILLRHSIRKNEAGTKQRKFPRIITAQLPIGLVILFHLYQAIWIGCKMAATGLSFLCNGEASAAVAAAPDRAKQAVKFLLTLLPYIFAFGQIITLF